MKRWLKGAGLRSRASSLSASAIAAAFLFVLGPTAPAQAATHLPVGLLSKTRVGVVCADSVDATAALDCWLRRHPDVANAMIYEEANFQGTWPSWPAPAKDTFHDLFNQMVLFYKLGMPANYPQPLSDPLTLQGPSVWSLFGTHLSEADGRTEYLLLVANNIAAELTAAFPWSIQSYTLQQNLMLLSMGEALGHWQGAPQNAVPGYYFVGAGHMVPATPVYTVTLFKKNQLFGPGAAETLANFFAWERNLTHYFLDEGVTPSDMVPLFWGPNALPIEESQVIDGSTYTGPSGPTTAHWTQGCWGTAEFMKVVLQAVNIPVGPGAAAGHATPVFPTLNLAMTHGDDPYDRTGWVSPVPGFPTPQPLAYLTSISQVNNLCDPNWPDPDWCQHKVGILPAMIGIVYGSDYLMQMHCQDKAAGNSHANSMVLSALKWYWPELSMSTLQTGLENIGMWTTLDAKVAAANFCQ